MHKETNPLNCSTENVQTRIESLIARCQHGWSLPSEFYSDQEVYRFDVDVFWRTG